MALEDLGIQAGALMDIQDSVKARISSASDSLEDITGLLKTYSIGGSFHLAFILDKLTRLGLGPRDTFDKMAFGNAFLGRLLRYSAHHMLRELKYKTQMPVSRSYQLVGVADEGQAYIREGVDPDTVFTLKEGFIYGMCPLSSAIMIAHSWDCDKSVSKRPLTRNLYISKALA
jgi:RNA-dependent RNA polymerase